MLSSKNTKVDFFFLHSFFSPKVSDAVAFFPIIITQVPIYFVYTGVTTIYRRIMSSRCLIQNASHQIRFPAFEMRKSCGCLCSNKSLSRKRGRKNKKHKKTLTGKPFSRRAWSVCSLSSRDVWNYVSDLEYSFITALPVASCGISSRGRGSDFSFSAFTFISEWNVNLIRFFSN